MAPDISDGVDRVGHEAPGEGDVGSPPHPETRQATGPASELALNRLLEAEPRSVLLNIRKADWRVRAGDDALACYFYGRALHIAGDRPLPQEEAAEMGRAKLALAEAAGRAHSRRVARLTERALAPQQWSPRLRASLELAAGLRSDDVEDPARPYSPGSTHFHYTGLPQIQFYDPGQFDWVPAIEAATAAICEELNGLLASGTAELRPFVQNDDGMPLGVSKALSDGRDWGVLALCEQGWLDPDYIKRCPRTWDTLLRHVPVPRVSGWGPSAVFSILKAGAHIGAHTGMYNTRLICHLPLIVPPGCAFPCRQRGPRMGGGQAADLRRHDRARSLEQRTRGSRGADLRYLAARVDRAGETRAHPALLGLTGRGEAGSSGDRAIFPDRRLSTAAQINSRLGWYQFGEAENVSRAAGRAGAAGTARCRAARRPRQRSAIAQPATRRLAPRSKGMLRRSPHQIPDAMVGGRRAGPAGSGSAATAAPRRRTSSRRRQTMWKPLGTVIQRPRARIMSRPQRRHWLTRKPRLRTLLGAGRVAAEQAGNGAWRALQAAF